jgi:hypothetical protein
MNTPPYPFTPSPTLNYSAWQRNQKDFARSTKSLTFFEILCVTSIILVCLAFRIDASRQGCFDGSSKISSAEILV